MNWTTIDTLVNTNTTYNDSLIARVDRQRAVLSGCVDAVNTSTGSFRLSYDAMEANKNERGVRCVIVLLCCML